jgi:hypothetical protein
MPRAVYRVFGGMRPGKSVDLLQDGEAAYAVNARLTDGSIEPAMSAAAVMTLSSLSQVASIYRFGQTLSSDIQYWFEATADADFVKGPIADDTQERTYFTGIGGYPRKTDATMATSVAPYPTASYKMGVPKPSFTPSCTVSGTAATGAVANSVVYVVTYVSSWGEEGAPCTASAVATYYTGQTVTVTLPAAPAGNYNITNVRLYRSNSGTTTTKYQLVTELAIGTPSFVDNVSSSALGETLPSTYWDEPDDTMVGLVLLPGSGMAGFFENQLCFCEPGYPHAWPIRYRQSMPSPIVALGVFDQTLVVFCQKATHFLTGTDPSSMVESMTIPQVCLSKRSVRELMVGGVRGVAFAGLEGLWFVSSSGMQNLTESLMSQVEWSAYNPASFSAYTIDERYIAFYDNGVKQAGIVLRLGDQGYFSETDLYATAGYREPKSSSLFLATAGNQLVKWEHGATPMTYTWRSGTKRWANNLTMAVARVEAAAYPVTFKFYADGNLVYTKTVADANDFRLPSGYRCTRTYFEVSGTSQVKAVLYATTVDEQTAG